ncbi:MAG: sigma-70 family RNA polymerase sigma factor [Bacteroidota bacterium]
MEDIEVWNAYRKGDKASFERIYKDHIRILYKYGNRFTNDHGLVEDCIQELFIDLWNKRNKIGDTDSIKRYLLGALRRRIVRKIQRDAKQKTNFTEGQYDFRLEANFEELLIKGEHIEETKLRINKAFEKLSKRQKEVIYLKFYQEQSYKEIEDTLGINYQSVRNLLHNALKAIKAALPHISNLLILFSLNFFS